MGEPIVLEDFKERVILVGVSRMETMQRIRSLSLPNW